MRRIILIIMAIHCSGKIRVSRVTELVCNRGVTQQMQLILDLWCMHLKAEDLKWPIQWFGLIINHLVIWPGRGGRDTSHGGRWWRRHATRFDLVCPCSSAAPLTWDQHLALANDNANQACNEATQGWRWMILRPWEKKADNTNVTREAGKVKGRVTFEWLVALII